ncbi:MAG: GTPase HflX, partial [Actinobacteria bacterium]
QERNLNDLTGTKVIDRTALILDIFASTAHSKEGKIQVGVAQYNYLLPRLTGRGIALSRLGGGIGTRGPGETVLEADRRRIRKRLDHLNKQLRKIETQRITQRKKRSLLTERISLVGYTNSGKSTLLNSLTNAKAEVADKLFSTVDARTRRLYINKEGGHNFTISDTVGFIEKLPTMLIEAFKSTLSEVQEADIVLHVIDASNENFERQIKAVESILRELKVKLNIIKVFNKIDLLDQEAIAKIKQDYPQALIISALAGLGIEKLKRKIATFKLGKKKT